MKQKSTHVRQYIIQSYQTYCQDGHKSVYQFYVDIKHMLSESVSYSSVLNWLKQAGLLKDYKNPQAQSIVLTNEHSEILYSVPKNDESHTERENYFSDTGKGLGRS